MAFRPIRDRANVVCVECHSRKVKCDLQNSPDETCRNCRRAQIKCIRRDGVRKKRKLAHQDGVQPQPRLLSSLPGGISGTGEGPRILSTAQLGCSARIGAEHGGGFIANSSIMSYDPASDPAMQDTIPPRIVSARDAILKATQADVLPPPALLQALKDSFIEHVLPFYPVLDPGELSDPDASILLLQAVCLAGSLMRYDQKGLQLGYSLYEKAKVLLHVEYESDHLTVLKTLCLMSCWSPASPYIITHDGPWHWVGMAVRMATQMGLHKQTTYTNHVRAGCLRRIFWHLRISEWMMVACWGRPPALRPEDYDVLPLTERDFSSKGLPTLVSVHLGKLMESVGKIAELNSQKNVASETDVANIVSSLCDWQQNLPESMRQYNSSGAEQHFYRHTSELLIYYFTAIILVQMLIKDPHTQWRTSGPSVLAASCVARLYDEIHCREQSSHLLHIHAFPCLVSAVVLISYRPRSQEKEVLRNRDLEVIYSTMEVMRTKYGGARVLLGKIQRLQSDVESGKGYSSPPIQSGGVGCTPRAAKIVEDRLDELFPFPIGFCENMDMLEPRMSERNLLPVNDFVAMAEASFEQSDNIFSMMDMLGMNFDTFDAMNDDFLITTISQPSEKLILGAQMAHQFLGQELMGNIQANSRDDLPSKVSAEYIAEVCFSSYARPGLEFKERSLMNIAMMIALNRAPKLRIHIRAALHNGLSEEQIVEACRHAMIYCGVPAGREALSVASKVFQEVTESKMAGDSKL